MKGSEKASTGSWDSPVTIIQCIECECECECGFSAPVALNVKVNVAFSRECVALQCFVHSLEYIA
jgi:hypothetical protein